MLTLSLPCQSIHIAWCTQLWWICGGYQPRSADFGEVNSSMIIDMAATTCEMICYKPMSWWQCLVRFFQIVCLYRSGNNNGETNHDVHAEAAEDIPASRSSDDFQEQTTALACLLPSLLPQPYCPRLILSLFVSISDTYHTSIIFLSVYNYESIHSANQERHQAVDWKTETTQGKSDNNDTKDNR